MMMPTSSEFTALCQSQITILTQGLGATVSVVYLMQHLGDGGESQLVPIMSYPDSAIDWQGEPLQLPSKSNLSSSSSLRLLPEGQPEALSRLLSPVVTESADSTTFAESTNPSEAILPQRQVVLPLVQENVMLGLLVVGREDRGWNQSEQAQIEQVANTLAIACVLDQRYQWLETDRQQERQIQIQQTDRLDNLLHQFRNSLTALQTFGKLILRRLQPEDRNREAAASLVRETVRLRELAQQLESATIKTSPLALPPPREEPEVSVSVQPPTLPLLTASLPSRPLTEKSLTLNPCNVNSVLEPLLASAATMAQDRHLSLDTLIPEQLPLVWADAQALREVLNNLIENALKYTPSGGHILVQISLLGLRVSTVEGFLVPWLEVAISDTGPGIPAQDLPHIFERRFRGVQATAGIPGTGLGLAIAKSLVEQMQGEIEVQSPTQIWETLGVQSQLGTSLKLRLPTVSLDTHETRNLTT